MATTATRKGSSPARRSRPTTPSAGKVATQAAGKAATSKTARKAVTAKPVRKATEKVASKTLKTVARKTLKSGAGAIRVATERAASAGRSALERNRLPIQLSIDVA